MSFTSALDRRNRPVVVLVAKHDVEIACFRFAARLNRPRRGDVILPLGADLTSAQLFEPRRFHLVEESVEEIRSLIATEKARLIDDAGELQHHLIAIADSSNDRLRVAPAKTARQVRHGGIEVLELR